MKVAFHTFTLNYRGTAVAIYDYAKYNQEVLGNESVIVYNSSVPYEKDVGTEDESLEFIKKSFEVLQRDDLPLEKNQIMLKCGEKITYIM